MAKSIVKKTVVAVLILSLVLTTGLLSIKPQAVDISDNISVALWNKTGGANELTYAAVQFPSGVLPNGLNYGILDNNSYKYIGDYIEFCGCSVNSINATTDTSGYSFSTFPSTADVKYRLPIILFQNGNTIEIKVHNTYLSGIAGAPTITVKSGLTFNSSGEYSVEKDVTFKYENNKWSSSVAPAEVDITDKLAVNGWVDVGNASELKYAGLTFPSNALPNTIQYGILDNDAYKFIADYITLNGITVNSINANTDTSGYVFSTFPSTADAKYRLPVILFQNGNTIEIKIHKKYVETLGKKITVGVLSGLNISNGNKIYKVTENVNFVLENGVWSKDIPPVDMDKKVSITGFDVTGDAGELKYTRVVFEDGILPKTIGYSVIEKSNYAYIADYIAINGKTVSEINANTDVSEYNFNTFPSSVSADYALPIIVYQNGNALEVKIHRNYINSIIETGKVSGNADITVSLIKGFKLFSGGKTYMLQNNIDYKAYEYIAPDDISGKVSIDGFLKTGDENELYYSIIKFDSGILPQSIAYGVMDNDNYKYIADFITVNGKTVNEINTGVDTSGYKFSTFPSNADDKYKLPIIVFQNGDTLEVKIHEKYVDVLKENAKSSKDHTITIALMKDLILNNGQNSFALGSTVSYTAYKYTVPTDISSKISINGWQKTGDAGELYYSLISFGKGVLPQDIGYGIIDNNNYKYLAEYILINGKSVDEINKTVKTADYNFATFPSSVDGKYKLPVIIYQNGNDLEIKIHSRYIESELFGKDIVITVKKGFNLNYGVNFYIFKKDISSTVFKYVKTKVKSLGKISLNGWQTNGDKGEYKSTFINFESGRLPSGIDYKAIDDLKYMYFQDYIKINGKTVREINRFESVSGYGFYSYPANKLSYFRLPVIIYVSGDTVEVRIHKNYAEKLGKDFSLSVLKGLYVSNGNIRYVLDKDYKFDNSRGIWQGQGRTVDIYNDVNVFGWVAEGKTTHSAYIEFGNLPVLSKISEDPYSFGKSLLEFITVNGKTAKEINDSVDVSNYTFDTFPSNTINSYKCPVILYANPDSNTLQVRIHDSYIKDFNEIIIGINENFIVERKASAGLTYYILSDSVKFKKVGDKWGNTEKEYSVTYYLNGKKYGEEQKYSFMEKISVIDAPELKEGYSFGGWKSDDDLKSGIMSDIKIYGYVLPIRYRIIYKLNGGKNNPDNPIFYDVQSETIKLAKPNNGTMKFEGWYTDKSFKTKINGIKKGSVGDITLYAKFSGKQAKKFNFADIIDGYLFDIALGLLAICSIAVLFAFIKVKKKTASRG